MVQSLNTSQPTSTNLLTVCIVNLLLFIIKQDLYRIFSLLLYHIPVCSACLLSKTNLSSIQDKLVINEQLYFALVCLVFFQDQGRQFYCILCLLLSRVQLLLKSRWHLIELHCCFCFMLHISLSFHQLLCLRQIKQKTHAITWH